MPDSVNGGSNPPPKKEMSMELRLLVAFLLMGAVLFLTPYIPGFKSTAPPPQKKTVPAAASTPAPAPPPELETPATPAADAKKSEPAAASSGPATAQQVLPPLVIDTDVFRVAFSNQGGTVRSWQLKKYRGNDGKPLELINAAANLDFPFSLYFPSSGPQPASKINWTYYQQTPDPDGLGVTYEYSDGHTSVRKTFRFEKNSYLSQVTSAVTIDGKPVPAMLAWRGGFGDLTVPNPSSAEKTLYYNLAENKLVEQTAKSAKNGPLTNSGDFSFAGLADLYFAGVFLPQPNSTTHQVTFSDTTRTVVDEKPEPYTGVAVSNGETNNFRLFVGPKNLDLLKSIDPKLEQVVNFGEWLGVIAKPLFLIVDWFNKSFVHNFGWSIVVVTIVINFVLFPLKLSNMKSMRKMQALKPQIDAINDKYKKVGLRDPRKAEQNQEVMDLYKKYGVNPMGGCFPMLIQIPFFFAFYRVFTVSVQMRGASWLWVTDLSQPEHLPIKILPLVMIASQFMMQKMTPQPNQDPGQQKMMMLMPLVFGFMFYNFPSGLVLYYLTSNLVSMGQQWFFNHTETAQEVARSVELPKKKNVRK
jgi:YidC/Oxa1 family membrane protein insertase